MGDGQAYKSGAPKVWSLEDYAEHFDIELHFEEPLQGTKLFKGAKVVGVSYHLQLPVPKFLVSVLGWLGLSVHMAYDLVAESVEEL